MPKAKPKSLEDALYEAMTAGDWETVEQLRADALEAGPTDAEQFEDDHAAALARYHADHEAPEDERERNTRDQVAQDNEAAPE